MSLDPRSRERLEALGRRLPQPLPAPEPKPSAPSANSLPRHRLESEQDPQQLFRELMAASPDGSVPPHLLERLRELEGRTAPPTTPAAGAAPPPTKPAKDSRRLPLGRDGEEEDPTLYAAFAQMLLEQEDD
jgi:hypothetical protein